VTVSISRMSLRMAWCWLPYLCESHFPPIQNLVCYLLS